MDFKEVYQFTKDLNVLYVEDESKILENTTEIFESFFNSVTPAKNGQIGLDLYFEYHEKNNQYFDLVITDILMPEKDGLSMIDDIIRVNFEQPIIVTSAHDESGILIKLIQKGVTNFIMKPFTDQELLNSLYNTCKNISIKKENILLEIEKKIQKEQKNIIHQKMLAMSDMIDNIAHQYRQPLSIISTIATGIKVSNEMGELDEKMLSSNCDKIYENVQYLSNVIDDFRTFINYDIEKKVFNISHCINEILEKQKRLLDENGIDIITNFDKSLSITSYKNLFYQSILNVFINAIDVLSSKSNNERYIFIDIFKEDKNFIISIKDNAGGINEEIISKVFEIYFTTKDKFVGTGLGLYITYNIITRQIGGNIEVKNEEFIYKNKNFKGANFKLTLPIEEK
jgi:signal transduction histidine kinase